MSASHRSAAGLAAVVGPAVPAGLLLAYGVGGALHVARAEANDPLGPMVHWLRDASMALPLALGVAIVSLVVVRAGLSRLRLCAPVLASLTVPVVTAVGYSLAVVPAGAVHKLLFENSVSHHAAAESAGVLSVGAQNAGLAVLVGIPLLVGAAVIQLLLASLRKGGPPRPTRRRRSVLAVTTGLAMLAGISPAPAGTAVRALTPEAGQLSPISSCNAGTADRRYDVFAINVHIAYNRWGQGNPNGMVYALRSDVAAVRDWHKPLTEPGSKRRVRPRPLVLRANEGECVEVQLTNGLDATQGEGIPDDPRTSISVRGVPFDVQSSGGSHVGHNDDTTIARGESRTHYWLAPEEGAYFFHDTAIPAGSEGDGGSLSMGLYGVLVVEPPGSVWRDPRSGKLLYTETVDQSGDLYINAVIDPGEGRTFREAVQLAQDELPFTSTFAFNYGSEPSQAREQNRCPDCISEETSLSSWVYGDPSLVKLASGFGPWRPSTAANEEDCGLSTPGFDADSCFVSNVVHAYVGDPIKFRFGMAGGKETHVFHMHAHQWLAEDKDVGQAGRTPSAPGMNSPAESTTIDSQTFGPMEMFTADLLFGAGSKNGTVGDAIFHCHLYPHFANGFWSLLRVHDVREDGTGRTPDGLLVPGIKALNDLPAPPEPTATNPGYPRFIPGEFGWRAPQPPLGITDGGAPADRFVAGEVLDPTSAAAQLESSAMNVLSGGRSKPGAPFNDPCPPGAREVTYKVSTIQLDVTYNRQGDHDVQGRVIVPDADVADILAGRKRPEPLFARVSAGDCVNWELTNRLPNWFGGDAFVKQTQTNLFGQHIHLVKFDVMASDGASNGWNYAEGAFSRDQADFNAAIAGNPATCTPSACRLSDPATYDPTAGSKGLAPGQTIHERWYADYELRTVFTHDHHFAAIDQNRGQYGALVVSPAGMDFRDPRTGAYRQPVSAPGRGVPLCGQACEGEATGAMLDVIGPGADDDYRDFGLAIADFVSLTKAGGDPTSGLLEDTVNAPLAPEAFPDEDPGVMAINYANAPLKYRTQKNGQPVDPAHAFSSTVFGDPDTPLLQSYAGDNVRIRLIQGAQEEQHQVLIHGQKWRKEPNDPHSPFVDAVPVGVSEAFNFEVPRFNCSTGEDCRGDYLYSGSSIDDIWTGAWGLLRVNGGIVPGLKALPDNVPASAGSVPSPSSQALAPPQATDPGQPCTPDAPLRRFDVVAMQSDIRYNEAGDHDPFGLVYALAGEEEEIRAGKNPEPLVLRVNEGDCIEITLTNKLTNALRSHRGSTDGDAPVPDEAFGPRPPGLRVSMHAAMLKYDVRGSDGAAVGYNADSTVGPGASITYRWFANEVTPGEIGAVNITDFGDVRGHRHHGLFAGLVVEPKGASWTDQRTGDPLRSGAMADIRVPGARDFRENVLFFQDGLNLRTRDGALIADPEDHPPVPGEPVVGLDPEDTGEKAFSYRNAPFRHRLGFEPVTNASPGATGLARVYDSDAHGDPATPILRAYEGDDVTLRILQGSDKPRQHAFSLSGHGFKPQPHDPDGRSVGTISAITVGTAINADMGRTGPAGDYLYGCMVGFFHRSGGLWGMLRVYPRPTPAEELSVTELKAIDDPRAGGHPLLPLGLSTIRTSVWHDGDGDGVKGQHESPIQGAGVVAVSATRTSSGTTDREGRAHLSVPAGGYSLQVTVPADYAAVAPLTVSVPAGGGVVDVPVPLRLASAPSDAAAPLSGSAPAGTPSPSPLIPPDTAPPTTTSGGATATSLVLRPLAPQIVSVRAGRRGGPETARLRWRSFVVVDRPVTGYRVKVMRVAKSGAVLLTTYKRVEGDRVSLAVRLPQPGVYQFRVRAVNDVGRSSWSARSSRVQGR